jgi:MerR family mercuric resistance operon transcriptional regulator/MerR family gold-responsive transcriptional activator of gol and ges genes
LGRLRFIKNAQSLGFTLREIAELLSPQVRSVACCANVRQQACVKLEQVEAKVRDLQVLGKVLRGLIVACQAGQPTERCPILQTLEKNERMETNGNRKTMRFT